MLQIHDRALKREDVCVCVGGELAKVDFKNNVWTKEKLKAGEKILK